MSIKISIKKSISPKVVKNYVLFCNENFKINALSNLNLKNQSNFINKLIDSNKLIKKDFLILNITSIQKIILVKIKKNQSSLDNEKLGAKFFDFIKENTVFNLTLYNNNIRASSSNNLSFFNEFMHGLELKSYEFKKYKSKKDKEIFNFDISSDNKSINFQKDKRCP